MSPLRGTAARAEPLSLELIHPEATRKSGRCCLTFAEQKLIRSLVMLYSWISRCCAKGKDKKGKGDKKGQGKGKKSESSKDEKDKDDDKKGKGKGKANAKTTNHFPAQCLDCKACGCAKKDCWCSESAKSGKDAASQQRPITPAAKTTTGTPITGMLMQSDEGEVEPTNCAKWLYSVTKRRPSL